MDDENQVCECPKCKRLPEIRLKGKTVIVFCTNLLCIEWGKVYTLGEWNAHVKTPSTGQLAGRGGRDEIH